MSTAARVAPPPIAGGWGWAKKSSFAHWFRGGQSLCVRYAVHGVNLQPTQPPRGRCCVACLERLAELRRTQAADLS